MVEKIIKNRNMSTIPLDKINIGNWNVRTLDREKGVDELVESILKYGLLQPIVVFQEGDKYNLIIGQRRVKAFLKLKKKEIQAVILPVKPDEEHLKILSLSENIHRVEVNRADIVEVISYLYNKHGKSAKEVAKILGKSVPFVYDHLKIKDAPEEIMQMLSRRDLKKVDVKRLMEIAPDDKETMIELAKEMKKLTPYERKRLGEIGKIKPKAKVKELIEETKKPRIEEKIIVPLTPSLLKSLDSAVKEIGLSREEIAKKALEEWLGNKGYYKG